MRKPSALPGLIFVVILCIGLAIAYSTFAPPNYTESVSIAVASVVIAYIVSYSIKVADQWQRVVVLRLGRFRSLEGPGLFFIIPIIETVAYWIDTRVITNSFKAEKTLTKDTVPVDVDAVLFWKVVDPKKAALDVADYVSAINWASQTALRDVIGKTMLSDMLEGREKISERAAEDHRCADRALGDQCHFGGGQGCADPFGFGGCDVDAGAGGTRTPGARHPWRFRAPGRGEIRRGGEDLRKQSDRLSFAGDEHALRGIEEKQRHDRNRAEHGGRNRCSSAAWPG